MPGIEAREKRRRWLAGAVIALTVVLVLTELLFGSVRAFWVEHPITAALVGFAVTLALTVMVIDELLERRASERWGFVGEIAIKKLSGEAFRVCAGLINLVGFEGQADRMLAAVKHARTTGECPGRGAPPLLPEEFEQALDELLDDADARDAFVEIVRELSRDLDAAMAHWSPVMLSSAELAEVLNVYGMMSYMLGYVASAADQLDGKVEETAEIRLDFWSNLRVYLILFASFDTMRRRALHEPAFFGFQAEEQDRAWGLPFQAQREALARRSQ